MSSKKAEEIIKRYFNKATDPLYRELAMLDNRLEDKLLEAVILAHRNNAPVLENVEVYLPHENDIRNILVSINTIQREYSNGYAIYNGNC